MRFSRLVCLIPPAQWSWNGRRDHIVRQQRQLVSASTRAPSGSVERRTLVGHADGNAFVSARARHARVLLNAYGDIWPHPELVGTAPEVARKRYASISQAGDCVSNGSSQAVALLEAHRVPSLAAPRSFSSAFVPVTSGNPGPRRVAQCTNVSLVTPVATPSDRTIMRSRTIARPTRRSGWQRVTGGIRYSLSWNDVDEVWIWLSEY
ncbi:hypothetical protein V8D89_011757 [Ganoderma adspersum]